MRLPSLVGMSPDDTLASMVVATPIPLTSSTPAANGQPTLTSTVLLAVAEETDCMGACHEIDINELFKVGAKHQPASHKGYATCLECHAALTKPALPATHVGRLDATCIMCHTAA